MHPALYMLNKCFQLYSEINPPCFWSEHNSHYAKILLLVILYSARWNDVRYFPNGFFPSGNLPRVFSQVSISQMCKFFLAPPPLVFERYPVLSFGLSACRCTEDSVHREECTLYSVKCTVYSV